MSSSISWPACVKTLILAVLVLATTIPAHAEVADRDGDHALLLVAGDGGQSLHYQRGSETPVVLSAKHHRIDRAQVVDSGVEAVIFATWRDEQGRDYVALSTDSGGSWTRPRVRPAEINLRAAVVAPGQEVDVPEGPLAAKAGSRVLIVQFHAPSLAVWRQRLTELGAEVLSYLPYNAHVVRMGGESVQQVAAEPFVRWVGPYHPIYRLEAGLLSELEDPDLPVRRYVLQTFTPGEAEKSTLANEVIALGGEVVLNNPNGYLLEAELSGRQALQLLSSNHLQWLEPWRAPEDDMDNARAFYGANYIETVGGYDGTGVRAEVMDSGTMQTHQDFDGMLKHGGAPSLGDHGTCTYGIVFGNGDRDGDGDGTATGFMPAAQGYFADYSYLVDRYTHTAELVSSPIEAVFQSNSWGSGRTLHYTAVSAEMDDIIWLYDIPIFQSQSNSGDQYSRPQAWAKNIISVGGINHYNDQNPANDCWCSTASIGPAEDGRFKPDLAFWYDATWTTDREPGGYAAGLYANFGGTSGATPMTAGSAGLILQMYADDLWGNNPGAGTVFEKRPHAATLKALLINTAEQYDFAGLDHDLTRVRQGWGLPNLAQAYDRAALTAIVDEESVLEALAFDAYLATVDLGQSELKITMVYADRAANPAAAIHRVNDVTLRVIAPNGTVYWGNNGLDTGPWSTPGGAADTINTVENVFVQNPMAGDWRVEVWADEVNMDVHAETPEDDQDYALVVYGASLFAECRSTVAAPTGLAALPSGDNQVSLSWSGSTSAYEVWRSEGGCGMAAELVATVGSTGFVDTAVPGGVTFGYLVRAVDGCPSPDSGCVEAVTTGACALEPRFDGLEWATGTSDGTCAVDLSWSAATARCGGALLYNVYRDTDPAFVPGPDNRIAACVSGLALTDTDQPSESEAYSYVVRAEDLSGDGSGACGGIEDSNTIGRRLTPTTLVSTDFEAGLDGWISVEPVISVTGDWVVDDPKGTVSGADPAQPENAHGGINCLYTGRNPAQNVGRADVDYGEVEAWSPTFDASAFTAVELRLWRWFFIQTAGVDSGDYFAIDVSADGGSSWTNLETLDLNTTGQNAWTEVSFNLESFVTLSDSMVVRVRASDGDTAGTIIEAAIDDVSIRGSNSCTPASLIFTDGFESGDSSAWTAAVP